MYSNDQVQIRQGLVSYIGAIIKTSNLEGRAARQNAAAILIEEALKIAQDNEDLDFYVLKPLLRGNMFALNHRVNELAKLPATPEIKNTIKDYRTMVTRLERLVDSVK
jgi:hypothetical protein